ncbi:hypothetical protein L2E82_29853 [Cichorium intybus]|uniref:Uncharacterized protein n=1 Tax=Cichorium intybus TaxID=13427 RepID=A0ACB9CYQ4_CICIN|nr:hypothetical protein L2E82_29853 [Cichorium intybus]
MVPFSIAQRNAARRSKDAKHALSQIVAQSNSVEHSYKRPHNEKKVSISSLHITFSSEIERNALKGKGDEIKQNALKAKGFLQRTDLGTEAPH